MKLSILFSLLLFTTSAFADISIVSPTEDEAVRANNGMVTVVVDTTEHVEYVVDGMIRTPEERLEKGAVLYLYRGTHELQVFIIKDSKRVNSETVTFHVLRVHKNKG